MPECNSFLCLPCVVAMARFSGPTAGREGSMDACGPTERQKVMTGKTAGTLRAATDTLTTDMPGKSISLLIQLDIHLYVEIKGLFK